MREHTPGPWTLREFDRLCGPDGEPINVCGVMVPIGHVPPEHVGHANARLIAASPEMLSVIKAAEWAGEDDDCPLCGCTKALGHQDDCPLAAAIAKAEGRST